MSYHKKLIEVALPLEAINKEAAREKSIRHGHPSTLHLWWARRPLAACRAVLFAQMVDDPSSHPELFPTEAEQNQERERLFDIIRDLVLWENINNEKVLERARAEIRRYAPPEGLPPVLDPFAGGGSIPLEAQRLGLEAHASDLNPVAVLINKALIEIPPKFANMPPVNPESRRQKRTVAVWRGAQGLAEDVRYYGQWMRDEAEKQIGYLYPKVKITEAILAERQDLREQGLLAGEELTVIAWLWARTVTCPNPVCGATVPLTRSFWLSSRKNNPAWLEAVPDKTNKNLQFKVHSRQPSKNEKIHVDAGTKTGRGANFICLVCNQPVPSEHVKETGKRQEFGEQLLAVVTEGNRRRVYFAPEQVQGVQVDRPNNVAVLAQQLADDPRAITVKLYGYETFDQLFTNRQLTSLLTFSGLLDDVYQQVIANSDDNEAYAQAVITYLAFAIDKATNYWSNLCGWHANREIMMSTLGRQALPMIWDFTEANPFSTSSGNWWGGVEQAAKGLENLPTGKIQQGIVKQADAAREGQNGNVVVSTDPPYYDNVPYSDVSDFFYVWLRQGLGKYYPDLFGTLLTPKSPEIVAFSYRFDGDQRAADIHFEDKLGQAFQLRLQKMHPNYPMTVYYAFKQQELLFGEGTASTGWEKMLEGLSHEFQITGTWPMRTEQSGGLRLVGRNSLASSIILVCYPRPQNAPMATRRDFLNALRRELPAALKQLQKGNIAPVDLAQASIGPGMAIFSRYSKVIEADGSPMRVRTALALINQALDEYLSEQEGEYDPDTRWALAWFEQFGFKEGVFGDAETLSKAKNTSVGGMVQAGFLEAGGGKVRLLRREELNPDWDPASDQRLTVWEVTQYLIRTMEDKGETAAAALLTQVGPLGEAARDLAYRLYQICERKGWAQEALPYNGLVVAWSDVGRLAIEAQRERPVQSGFDF